MSVTKLLFVLATANAASVTGVWGQDLNIALPIDSADFLLRSAELQVGDLSGARFDGDRTDRAILAFSDGTAVMAKLAPAPRGGEDPDDYNNEPRYELAAYELQKLFLDDAELVVPPTALRAFPLEEYRALDGDARATFRDAPVSVVVLVAYWLNAVTGDNPWDEERFRSDPAYARNWANLNLFTYLISHNDANAGNLQISTAGSPRVFAVDNGYAFNSIDSDQGTTWRRLQVERFPARTVERLRGLTEEDFHEALGVVAQFETRDDELVLVPPTENIDPRRGVRERDGVIQFGLTREEIDDTWYRLEVFLGQVDNGTYTTF